jgi:hypothetical protein
VSIEIEGPNSGSAEARASLALKLLAALNIGAVVLAMFPGLQEVAVLFTVAFHFAGALLAVVYLAVAFALDRRRPWAAAAVRPLLVVVAAAGIGQVLIAVSQGRARVPIDVVLSVWALLGTIDIAPIPRLAARSVAAVLSAAVLAGSMLVAPSIFGWGGLLDARQADIVGAVTADCQAAGPELPATVTIEYDWSWRSSAPMPSGIDIAVLGWSGADSAGRPLYVVDEIPASSDGLYSGLPGYPSTAMADQVAKESPGSYRFAVALPERQYKPGHIELRLRLARTDAVNPEPLRVTATYIHLGLWRQDPPAVTCSW